MLQELATETGASFWAIGSMLFFLAVWVAVAIRVVRSRVEDMDALARLPFEGDDVRRDDGLGIRDSGVN
jgi:hypothetical protein